MFPVKVLFQKLQPFGLYGLRSWEYLKVFYSVQHLVENHEGVDVEFKGTTCRLHEE